MSTKITTEDQFNELSCVSNSESGFGGYRMDLLSQNLSGLEKSLVSCPVCSGIVRNATVFDGKTTCYNCCEDKSRSSSSVLLLGSIGKLQVRCPLNERGCPWGGELGDFRTHLTVCEFLIAECPYAKYGCKFQSLEAREVAKHKSDSALEHLEMRMDMLELENSQLKTSNKKIDNQLNALLNKAKFSKFIESRKKCLEGVEWRVVPTHTGGQLEGPSFYISSYHLQLVGKVEDNLKFYVRRIPGEFDESLPPAQLTYSSAEQAGRAKTSNDSHEHKLELYSLSDEIDHVKCSPCIMRFYFDIEELY